MDFPSPASDVGYDVVPSPFGRGAGGEGDSTDWPNADWCCRQADDFAQIGPDDSAYVDIDPFEANAYEPAF